MDKEILEEFIDWARDNSESVWDIFENTEEMIEKFIKQREND